VSKYRRFSRIQPSIAARYPIPIAGLPLQIVM
jgi:hypothetical protein